MGRIEIEGQEVGGARDSITVASIREERERPVEILSEGSIHVVVSKPPGVV